VETHPPTGDVDRSRPPSTTHRPIPEYLQPFIVQQDASRYTAVDQAVWRFVLLMLHERLARTAHASYVRGLARSAISADHVPRIEEIDRGLSSIGWGAVCVDGFIPPRAFQAFQALGILPIAAEIRTPEHLPYTPAPDIIHEAAGHAPILIDPVYASYLRAIGAVGGRAFSSPADARVDRAVRALSDLKEHPGGDVSLEAAELELERAVAELGPPSEAARVARLYWWTAEYGLVGTPRDYRLYGAGLLSSLGESHFCHGAEVDKRELSADCTLQGYDITRPQPQLFVARDFEHLHTVLEQVDQTLAHRIGGQVALDAALASGELCTVTLCGGLQVIGRLTAVTAGPDGAPASASFERGAAIAREGRLLGQLEHDLVVPLGALTDGTDPRVLSRDVAPRLDRGGRLNVEYASGVCASGVPCPGPFAADDLLLWVRDVRIEWQGRSFSQAAPFPWLCTPAVVTASAGSACPDVSPVELHVARPHERPRVPKARPRTAAALRLERAYARAREARRGGSGAHAALERISAEIEESHPNEWLLVWNVLEALVELGIDDAALLAKLERRLDELETYYGGRHPIAAGLGWLTARKQQRP
jgi:phenylalanine-4-hydroxylase